jgi:heme oxygenase
MMSKPLLLRLREETAELHHALDDSGLVLQVVSRPDGLRQSTYGMWQIHESFERQCEHFSQWDTYNFSFDARRKTHFLEQDLQSLSSNHPLERRIEIPPIMTPNFMSSLGVMYVLEGSTLGGMLIAQHLLEKTHFSTAYYGCYGQRTAQMWREFMAAVEQFSAQEAYDEAFVVACARKMFSQIHQLYEKIAQTHSNSV